MACSAVGWELQNYGFYGINPTPDGGRLKPINVTERVSRTAGADTVAVSEGEFRIDTLRQGINRIWLVTRASVDADGQPVLDSIWMDRYSLRTVRSVTHDRNGVTELRYNRRQVRYERTAPNGRRDAWRGMLDAEPYGLRGIEVVLGALPLRANAGGALPVAAGRGDVLQWLHFQVVDQVQEPRRVGGTIVYHPVWMVQAQLANQTLHYWIDPEERSVVRRTTPGPDNTRMLVSRSAPVPRVHLAPVEPLGAGDASFGVLRQSGSSPAVGGP